MLFPLASPARILSVVIPLSLKFWPSMLAAMNWPRVSLGFVAFACSYAVCNASGVVFNFAAMPRKLFRCSADSAPRVSAPLVAGAAPFTCDVDGDMWVGFWATTAAVAAKSSSVVSCDTFVIVTSSCVSRRTVSPLHEVRPLRSRGGHSGADEALQLEASCERCHRVPVLMCTGATDARSRPLCRVARRRCLARSGAITDWCGHERRRREAHRSTIRRSVERRPRVPAEPLVDPVRHSRGAAPVRQCEWPPGLEQRARGPATRRSRVLCVPHAGVADRGSRAPGRVADRQRGVRPREWSNRRGIGFGRRDLAPAGSPGGRRESQPLVW